MASDPHRRRAKTAKLSTNWSAWRDRHCETLCGEGMPRSIAFKIADADAWLRQRLSRVIGWQTAVNAELRCIEGDDGKLRFQMGGPIGGLSKSKLARLEAEFGASLAVGL